MSRLYSVADIAAMWSTSLGLRRSPLMRRPPFRLPLSRRLCRYRHNLRDVQRRSGAAVLLVHHTRKSGSSRPGQALRGSSELHAWGDSNLYLRRRDAKIVMTVEHRAAPGLADIGIELADDGKGPALRLRRQDPDDVGPKRPTPEERVVQALADSGAPLTQVQIRQRVAARNATVGETLHKLVREGRVERASGSCDRLVGDAARGRTHSRSGAVPRRWRERERERRAPAARSLCAIPCGRLSPMIRLWDDRHLEEIRSQPLEPVAERLGYRRDPRDPRRWKRAGSVISINGPRWFDHVAQSGGGGAIDLVMHARRCGFADARGNAVFACTDAGRNVNGAEIVGTVKAAGGKRYRSMARGSRKAAGSFWLPVDRSTPETVILTESANEAISAWCIEKCRRPATVILSTAGAARRLPTWAEAWRPKRILVAFDADPVGDRAAERLVSEDPRARRMRPPDGHGDWNAVLKARAAAFPSK